ncbi:MAG TPA: hypothetical protein PJ982_15380 [Lacipirellulaceae bacterium]|nr:hypothetical protein [Lacipirellulaceae bacterium]
MIRRVSYIFVCAAVLPTWCSMTPQAAAHFPWLAVDEYQRAVLFFGESHQDRTYHVPEAVAQAVVLRRMAKMAPNPVELAAVETDEFVGRRSAEPVPQGGVLESEIAYGVYHGMRLDYYARFVSSGRAADISGSGLKLSATPRVHESGVDLTVVRQRRGSTRAAST